VTEASGRIDAETGILVGSGEFAQDARAPAQTTARIRVYGCVFMRDSRETFCAFLIDCKGFLKIRQHLPGFCKLFRGMPPERETDSKNFFGNWILDEFRTLCR
jgi:hypothetical protein